MTRIFAILFAAALAGCGSTAPECSSPDLLCDASGHFICQDGQWTPAPECAQGAECHLAAAIDPRTGAVYVNPVCSNP
jgi:hypothetical protein